MMQGQFLPPANFAGLRPPFSDFEYCRSVILPVPYDSTTEWHSGTRYGPRSIIEASAYLEWYDIELGSETHELGIHTLSELEPAMDGPASMCDRVYSVINGLIDSSKFVVMLGGEHSITYGSVRAHKEHYPNLSVLHLDAHTDLRDSYLGTEFSHACVMRRVVDICPITQVGIRSTSMEEIEFIKSRGLHPFFFEPSAQHLPVQDILLSLTNDVYISVDLDVLDPSVMPAVGTPEPGGLLWHELLALLGTLYEQRNIVGCDIVELCPHQGPAACAFLAAKLAYKMIGYSQKYGADKR